MTPEEAFGTIMKGLRKDKQLSQEQLAHSCGLDRTFISLLERGQRQPSLRSILAIAAALEMPADKLVKVTVESVEKGAAD